MAFPESFLDELTERCDIADVVSGYVRLTKKGANFFGLCPFHNEKTGSFSVSESKQIYYCFGCGKGGGVINFIMEIENLSYPDAVRFLAARAGMTVPEGDDDETPKRRRRMLELNRDAARFYNSLLSAPEGKTAAEYIVKRRISQKTARMFGLGAAPPGWQTLVDEMTRKGYSKRELLDAGLAIAGKNGGIYDRFRNRLMLPVIDVRGEVIAFGGRTLDGSEPKYMNSPETLVFSKRRSLYGINLAKNTKRKNFILCEGNIDVMTLHQAGFDNAVASMGTSLTTEQTKLIASYVSELAVCYDNDPAGAKATQRAIDLLKNSELAVKVVSLPDRIVDGKPAKVDVDDFIKLSGPEAFEKLLSGSSGHMEYELVLLSSGRDMKNDEQRVDFLKKAGELIARQASPVEREIYAGRAAETAGISRETMMAEIERTRKRLRSAERRREERETVRPEAALQPKARALRYDDTVSAAAEEGIVRLLLLDPSLIQEVNISQEEFSSPFLGKLFGEEKRIWSEKRQLTPRSLALTLTDPAETSELTRILQKPESTAEARSVLNQYIGVVRERRLLKNGDLMAMRDSMLKKKAYSDEG